MYSTDSSEEPKQFFSKKNFSFAKYSPTLGDIIANFIKDFYIYLLDKKDAYIRTSIFFIKTLPQRIVDTKRMLVSKMFWGRGSSYKYLGILGLAIPLLCTGIFFALRNDFYAPNSQLVALATSNNNTSSYSSLVIGAKSVPPTSSKNATMPQEDGVIDNGVVDWYKVQSGDTISSIATKYHISSDILMWANNLTTNNIKVGQLLHIVPVKGVVYTVKKGDTIDAIAKTYNIPAQNIIDWNLLSDATVAENQKILLPNAVPLQPTPNYYAYGYQRTYAQVIPQTPTLDVSQSDGSSWYYSQVDPRWGNYVIGGGYSAYSYSNIKNIGCLTTDVAMVAKYYGYNITPLTIASNYNNYYGVLFNWTGLGLFNVVPLGGLWSGYVNWAQINTELAQGHPVIVSVGYNYHYVILFKRLANGTYLMNDPARGPNLNFNAYFSPYSVTQAVLYTPYK